MKLNELKNGDIIVMRDGYTGIVLYSEAEKYILLPDAGFEFLVMYNDDMTYESMHESDIMLVYRPDKYDRDPVTFQNIEERYPLYVRDENWHRPTKEEILAHEEQIRKEREEEAQRCREELKANPPKPQHVITIMAQAFYGNRTMAGVDIEELDQFVLGSLSPDFFYPKEAIDRTIVHIPNAEHIVLIYNSLAEEERIEELEEISRLHPVKPTAVIPSLNLTLYSRCIVCRMDENGELQSLENEDIPYFIDYLSE